jgi:hypothetical protein
VGVAGGIPKQIGIVAVPIALAATPAAEMPAPTICDARACML